MADVFISYARKEIERAEIIKTALEARGLDVFFDIEGLDGGDAFPDILDREVKTCGAVLGLWSPYALSRPWVKIECRIGLDRKVLVPATIAPVPSLDMPAAFYNLHCIDLTDFDGQADHQGMKALWRALARTLKRPELLEEKVTPKLDTPIIGGGERVAVALDGAAQGRSAPTAQPGIAPGSPWMQSSDAAAQAAAHGAGAPESEERGAEVPGPAAIGSRILDWLLHERNRVRIGFAVGLVVISLFVLPQLLRPKPDYSLEDAAPAAEAVVADPAAETEPITSASGSALPGARRPNAVPGDSAGVASPPPPDKAMPEAPADPALVRAAAQGNAWAQTNLGWMYENGEGGLPVDKAEAVRLYRLAADQGFAVAQFNLGVMYANGEGGLAVDKVEAVRLYKLAADQGFAVAQTNLGLMYANGEGGLPVNKEEAVRLYRLAAAQGLAVAQFNLGVMYANGEGGLAVDKTEAVRLYRLAAAQGDADAQTILGIMYANGEGGLPQDRDKAIELYRQAARAGETNAQNWLRGQGLTW